MFKDREQFIQDRFNNKYLINILPDPALRLMEAEYIWSRLPIIETILNSKSKKRKSKNSTRKN